MLRTYIATPFVLLLALVISLTCQTAWGQREPVGQEKSTILILEITPDPRGALGSQQEWMSMLQTVGASRVTSGLGGAGEASIDEKESDRAITIRVKGYIDKGKLVLPGGKFTLRDAAKIKKLVEDFRVNGAEVALSEKKAFGLTAKQLVWLHGQLSVKVETETRGMKLGDVVKTLAKPVTSNSEIKFVYDELAQRVFRSEALITEELKGLSTGTALAAMLRPQGLVLEPVHIKANEIELHIKDSQSSEEHWPVGWPLTAPPIRVEPKMFEQMPINIKNFQMDKVMSVVQKRADVPFLYDQNAMAREGIDLTKTKVTLEEKSASLSVVVSRLLRQSKPRLAQEMRMDEAGKGFLWISP